MLNITKALSSLNLNPVLETSGSGSDANIFNQHDITALPVGFGVRSFHTTSETAILSEVLQSVRTCEAAIREV